MSRTSRGFSLAEVLVAMALFMLVLAGLGFTLRQTLLLARMQTQRTGASEVVQVLARLRQDAVAALGVSSPNSHEVVFERLRPDLSLAVRAAGGDPFAPRHRCRIRYSYTNGVLYRSIEGIGPTTRQRLLEVKSFDVLGQDPVSVRVEISQSSRVEVFSTEIWRATQW
ncbi:MAG: prepilin-type N-terminal cleavage/methylation domain-containing protein [Candidatus Eremiobacteraeota bacterium]|nr:prepilin-type N-terminal cleavage/methylation domain-containing protein [Candidatus Eremiobacteraeota bacterium]